MQINKGFWPFAVCYAVYFVLLALVYQKPHTPNYFVNLGYYIDILGNALAGGNPEVTVSARVGYNAFKRSSRYWNTCEKLINWAFEPIDGPDHCYMAYIWTKGRLPKTNIHKGSPAVLAAAMPAVVIVCIILRPIIWFIGK